jgi:hypothetical protein
MHCADNVSLERVLNDAVRVFVIQPAIADPLVGDEQVHLVGNDLADEPFEGGGIRHQRCR